MMRGTAERILEEVSSAVGDWSRFAAEAGVPADRAAAIASTHRLGLARDKA